VPFADPCTVTTNGAARATTCAVGPFALRTPGLGSDAFGHGSACGHPAWLRWVRSSL